MVTGMKTGNPPETSGSYFEARFSSATSPTESAFVKECETFAEADELARQLRAEGRASFVRWPSSNYYDW
jgi:hypothetical protein